MRWERAPVLVRLISLILGIFCLGVARHWTRIGRSGIDDIPPPYILLAGLAGLGFLSLTVIGRYPRPGE